MKETTAQGDERVRPDSRKDLPEPVFVDAGGRIAKAWRGVKVPDQVSVIGFDDLDMAAHFVPALTTVHQPRPEIGQSAARLLLERMVLPAAARAKSPGPRLVLPTELVLRETTAPPPGA